MSGPWGRNVHAVSPTKGKRRQSSPCEGCGEIVRYYQQPRRVRCRDCWSTWYRARAEIMSERLAAAFPNGEPIRRRYADDLTYQNDRYAYIRLESKLRNRQDSIPDDEILARLGERSLATAGA